MMSRLLAVALALALALLAIPGQVFAVQPPPANGSIAGVAHSQGGQTMVNTTVRLRNIATGQITGSTTSTASGGFAFTNLTAGQYVVEVVDAAGHVIGTSSTVSLAAGAMTVSGVSVLTAATAIAAGGSFFGSALGVLALAGVAAGVAGVTVAVTRNTASPSQ